MVPRMPIRTVPAVGWVIVLIYALPVQGMLLQLAPFTTDSAYCDDPSIDLHVQVVDFGTLVGFEFHNDSQLPSSIARIYFEQGVLKGITSILCGSGTCFAEDATPHNPPGWNNLTPVFETAFSADSQPPRSHNGIEPGEHVTVVFELSGGAEMNDLFNQLAHGTFRIGVHVISLPDGSSFSAVSPEPATLLLLIVGAAVLIRIRPRHRATV